MVLCFSIFLLLSYLMPTETRNPVLFLFILFSSFYFFLFSDFNDVGIFQILIVSFHLGEFIFVYFFHRKQVSIDSFLYNTSAAYTTCTVLALIEKQYFSLKIPCFLKALGGFVAVAGLLSRWIALYQAGSNFTHKISFIKASEHKLIKCGIYSICRHPGYSSWFWWSFGLQLLLGNIICSVTYPVISWIFFSRRIRLEENYLSIFFGSEYEEYKRCTPVLIPGIQ